MSETLTFHCIDWQSGSLLIEEMRVAALKENLITQNEARADPQDKLCRYALALSHAGKVIGCARLVPSGEIDRIVIFAHKRHDQIKATLIEMLKKYR